MSYAITPRDVLEGWVRDFAEIAREINRLRELDPDMDRPDPEEKMPGGRIITTISPRTKLKWWLESSDVALGEINRLLAASAS